MKILAIETSCDETAISIIEASGDFGATDFKILSNIVHSQVELHREYGGVYPNLAKREHGRNLVPVLREALVQIFKIATTPQGQTSSRRKAPPRGLTFSANTISKLENIFEREPELLKQFLEDVPKKNPGIDAVAVTYGPGLEPALWVGINFAKALSVVWDIPIIATNHIEGHIFSAFMKSGEKNSKFQITNTKFPMLALLVSGGHTELILIKDWLEYEKIGQTRDDAVGEAFDKVARILGLPYPGGPEISKLAERFAERGLTKSILEEPGLTSRSPQGGERSDLSGRRFDLRERSDLKEQNIQLPRPMINTDDFDFSFSGLKTAVLYMVKKIPNITEQTKADIAREFQQATIDVLISKTLKAVKTYNVKTVLAGGGVSANKELRTQLKSAVERELPDSILMLPDSDITGDNASMIAVAGYFKYLKNGALPANETLSAQGNLSL